jgi:redox-sensitive bicupin YhaK (pirin superfamily)
MITALALFTTTLLLSSPWSSDALAPSWRPLPHVERRDVLLSGASFVTANLVAAASQALPSSSIATPRSVASIDSNPAIPVWPTWGGGRVVPVSLGGPLQEPFLLLAHHDHWFDPRDPLRKPFKAVGKALSLPYVDVEGFSMHPHRGFDILTYVLDGSDGFQHRDSMGGSRTYRGGSAQWMRTGSGVLHEEFWETRSDRRTNIELFQLWINLPAARKFDPPVVHYIGHDTENPWLESDILDPHSSKVVGTVRNLGSTLDQATKDSNTVQTRPPVEIFHAKIAPGAQWTLPASRDQSALLYVRKGSASLSKGESGDDLVVQSQQTATFAPDGDFVTIRNTITSGQKKGNTLDLLVLLAEPLREPVAQAGPIVMNTQSELQEAYQQLNEGTFLDREFALRQQTRGSGRIIT